MSQPTISIKNYLHNTGSFSRMLVLTVGNTTPDTRSCDKPVAKILYATFKQFLCFCEGSCRVTSSQQRINNISQLCAFILSRCQIFFVRGHSKSMSPAQGGRGVKNRDFYGDILFEWPLNHPVVNMKHVEIYWC